MSCVSTNCKRLQRIFAFVLVTAGALWAQTDPSGPPQGPPTPAPTLPAQVGSAPAPVLYRFFFRHLANLDVQAAAMDAQGENGNEFRNYYQTLLQLSPADAASIKQHAAACVTAVGQLDLEAQAIVQQIKSAYPAGLIPKGATLPAPDPRLTQLTQQRDAITNAQIAAIQAALSATTFQKLDTYIKTQFARQISSVPIVPHPPSVAAISAGSSGGAK